jgi:low temperature requirement protein LtrA
MEKSRLLMPDFVFPAFNIFLVFVMAVACGVAGLIVGNMSLVGIGGCTLIVSALLATWLCLNRFYKREPIQNK